MGDRGGPDQSELSPARSRICSTRLGEMPKCRAIAASPAPDERMCTVASSRSGSGRGSARHESGSSGPRLRSASARCRSHTLQAQVAAEIAALAEAAAATLVDPGGSDDVLGTVEMAMREALHAARARLLEKILAADRGYRGPHVDCGGGHQADFVSYRTKSFDTVLGSIELCRAWYHCDECGHGLAPRDDELRLSGGSLSPGLSAMVDRVAAEGPFVPASELLGHLAGVAVGAKRIERAAEANGQVLAHVLAAEVAALAAGDATVVGTTLDKPEKLYVALDGTGVPTVAAEVKGRAAKNAGGVARTREAKLAVVITQTKLDDEGHPVRDPDSSSYLATFEPAESFGHHAELAARRRGSDHAARVVVLGDGAEWIWNLAERHFPAATHCVDLYHARQHLHALNRTVACAVAKLSPGWSERRVGELDAGDIDALLAAFADLELAETDRAAVDKQLCYFRTNRTRMAYRAFRQAGLFVGSGVVEAGCKTIIAERLKQSGMRWTTNGAAGIFTLRCKQASGTWDDSRQRLHAHKRAA